MLRPGDEITNAGRALHRLVSLFAASLWPHASDGGGTRESMADGVQRDLKHESSRASGTGHAFAAATVPQEQTERLVDLAWS